ncbi:hypothetical protein [Actinomadura sp. WMMB 499]|uniref:hypothetical protein n=1 Tax=Actinomadura sp. WMMB 499 TaxID=1219491 RepID=UPI001245CBBF|nr:hypothetical protein [Actinomadura sp. WMMB 499]QFG24626.1 hypothetical protein F7P10_29280 [Actinomadura sp. WMMB 499]
MDWRGRPRPLLRLRTRLGRDVAERHLELLVVALQPIGWRCLRLYERNEFPLPSPLLWVYASGAADDVGMLISVLAAPHGSWAYHDAQRGRDGFLFPCGDAKGVAEIVDRVLKHRMFPGTW